MNRLVIVLCLLIAIDHLVEAKLRRFDDSGSSEKSRDQKKRERQERREKRRPKARQDVANIKSALVTLSETDDGSEQWTAESESDAALKEDDEFAFGVMPEVGRRALIKRPPNNRIIPLKPGETKVVSGTIKLPATYDARQVWGQRCPSFNHIIDQGACGNCWSAHLTNLINHRTCQYAKPGEPQFFFSAKHLTTCLAKGCDGGWFANGLDFWIQNGIPSGGDPSQNETAGCKAYPVSTRTMKNATCAPTCDDGSPVANAPRKFGGARYQIQGGTETTEREIMGEIFLYGPVVATFDVYDDFAHYYKGGVYKRVSTKWLGGHATTLLGWGVEKGVKYWQAANSWGNDWGELGFFKIQRGTNEVNVESNIFAAVPREGLS